jgi:hypothetical protein
LVSQSPKDPPQPPPLLIGKEGQDAQAENANEPEEDPGEVVALVDDAEPEAHPDEDGSHQLQQ